jgi:oligoendopeptidase F
LAVSDPTPPLPRWRLERIVRDKQAFHARAAALVERSRSFEERWRGRIGKLRYPEAPAQLATLLSELGSLYEELSELYAFSSLRISVDTADEEARDLAGAAEKLLLEVQNAIRFVQLEWGALPKAKVQRLVAEPLLAGDRHVLERMHAEAVYRLAAGEERVFASRAPALRAFRQLHGRQLAAIRPGFAAPDGRRPHTIDELLSYATSGDRDLRRRSQRTLLQALAPYGDVLASCYDAIVADRLQEDELRGRPDVMTESLLANDLERSTVDAMLNAVVEHYPLARRWYERKAKLLGFGRPLPLADVNAPLGQPLEVRWPQAQQLALDALGRVGGWARTAGDRFFDGGRIDAPPVPGKRGGAFCASISRRVPPFILLNFTDQVRDVQTLIHELGHGIQFVCSKREQSPLSADFGIALAEVPSTFAEMVGTELLLERARSKTDRQSILASRFDRALATVYRQAMMVRFELDCYQLRAGGTTLTAERLGERWLHHVGEYFGESVDVDTGYRTGWSYIPHFIGTRFYTYAYAFAYLVSLLLVRRLRDSPRGFSGAYRKFLSAGSSASPAALLGALGIEIDVPGTWQEAFAEVERMLEEAERALPV